MPASVIALRKKQEQYKDPTKNQSKKDFCGFKNNFFHKYLSNVIYMSYLQTAKESRIVVTIRDFA